MAKISTYPEPNPPSLSDFLLGTDVSDSDNTKNFQISDIINLAKPYKVYTALLTQSGTSAPVATVLENTIGNIWWLYNADRQFLAKSNNLFTEDKTILFIQGSNDGDTSSSSVLNNLYWIDTYTINCILSEGNLSKTSVEIRVYN